MTRGLKRITGFGDLHFITFSCYQLRALLGGAAARNAAVQILAEVRAQYGFALIGYVIMPEHVHLLISEAGVVKPATVVQVFKQRVSRRLRGCEAEEQNGRAFPEVGDGLRRFWQRRYFDLNIYSAAKVPEKLHYMHANPVKAKLVQHPGDWRWSSWCYYYRGEGLLQMGAWTGPGVGGSLVAAEEWPTLCKRRKG
jgi:putative transposase